MLKPFLTTLIALFLIAFFIPALSYSNWTVLIVASLVLTLLQKIVTPLLNLLLLPVNIITLGLFSAVINAFILWAVVAMVPGFHIQPLIIFGAHLGEVMTLVLLAGVIGFVQGAVESVV